MGSGFGRGDANSRRNLNADFVATVRILIEAGASREDVHPGLDKPPSQEVIELLLSYGILPSIA